MLHLFVRRSGRAAITLLACISLCFVVLRLSGDPLDALLSDDAPQVIKEQYRTRWGLDRPLYEQYVFYIVAVFHADFGRSHIDGRDAKSIVAERIPATLQLGSAALLLAILIGLPAGLMASLKHGSLLDHAAVAGAIFGYAMPSFFLGLLLIMIFSLQLRLLPASGHGSFVHLILPAATLGLSIAGKLVRFVRAAVLDVIAQPFIRTARGKNLPLPQIVWRHILPNAAVPLVTFFGFELGLVIGGAVVTETVFGWPGVGRLLVDSVAKRDLAVVQAIVFLIASTMIIANLLVDLAYRWLDPRLRGGEDRL
jgi:peptide/nickel transport system permease protein